ncbi:MAG: hypothetical protein QOH06_2559 [Acidobacteriota bacterium]|jgi:hypothetical protein|nr:hypothetical protein [Acidobacteriota bacterium]
MQQILSPSALRFLGNLSTGASLEVELASRTAILPEVQTGSNGLFLDTLRANLHAAARHAALGHAGPSFRECHGPACIEAAKLLPELDPAEAATDAELDAILDQVMTSLEREGTSFLVSKPS